MECHSFPAVDIAQFLSPLAISGSYLSDGVVCLACWLSFSCPNALLRNIRRKYMNKYKKIYEEKKYVICFVTKYTKKMYVFLFCLILTLKYNIKFQNYNLVHTSIFQHFNASFHKTEATFIEVPFFRFLNFSWHGICLQYTKHDLSKFQQIFLPKKKYTVDSGLPVIIYFMY
jgi:hypothetical protein